MTDKPITQADLDAFRRDLIESLQLAGLRSAAAFFAVPTEPKPKPELPTMGTWTHVANDLLFDRGSFMHEELRDLARAIVAGDVELPRYKEE